MNGTQPKTLGLKIIFLVALVRFFANIYFGRRISRQDKKRKIKNSTKC